MSNAATLILIEQETADITIPIKVGKMSGHFVGEAIIRTKEEMKQLSEDMQRMAEEVDPDDKEAVKKQDEEVLRLMYKAFKGLANDKRELYEGDAAFGVVLNGRYSSYLIPAAVAQYYKQYGEALQANLPKRRWR